MISKTKDAGPDARRGELFGLAEREETRTSPFPWLVAGVVVLLLVAALLSLGGHRSARAINAVLPLDGYASSLPMTGVVMSESTSLSGGKSTFLDGRIRNNGTKTVTGATLQVLFANDPATSPQVETVPLTLIRTREPYVDTHLVSAAPLAPGDEREFRLIFEDIDPGWNQQVPEIRLVHVVTR